MLILKMANVWQRVFEVLGYALLENLVLIVCSDDDDMIWWCHVLNYLKRIL